jgi:hypothetical protein
MIEILNKKKKIGFIKGDVYLDKKRRLIGYLEGNIVKNRDGYPLLKLDDHNDIFIGDELVGFILDSKIYFREEPVFEISEEEREIYSIDGENILELKGNHQNIETSDLIGIATVFLKDKWWGKVFKLY